MHRRTGLPSEQLKLHGRGRRAEGYLADVVVCDPATIVDKATYDKPHQYAVGVEHVLVNGTPVISEGEHTGATPGRFVRGPGWTGWKESAPKLGRPRSPTGRRSGACPCGQRARRGDRLPPRPSRRPGPGERRVEEERAK